MRTRPRLMEAIAYVERARAHVDAADNELTRSIRRTTLGNALEDLEEALTDTAAEAGASEDPIDVLRIAKAIAAATEGR